MKEQVHGGDVYRHPQAIDFSANMNPLGTPTKVIAAAAKSLERIAEYPDVFNTELRGALAEYEHIPSKQIICGNGAAELIFAVVQALKPQRALLPVPTFAEYEQALRVVGCNISYHQMNESFTLDESLLLAIDSSIDILFICNPNNPTGFVVESKLLQRILDKCVEHKVFLVVDECFQDFIERGEEHTLKNRLSNYPNLFLLKAFTKRYAMAGIRLGYGLCGDEELFAKMTQVMQPWNVSIPAEAAGIAALAEVDYVKAAQQLVAVERRYLIAAMRRLKLKVYDSQANYIFFQGPLKLYKECLQRNILIRNCDNYQGLSKGFYRVAVRQHDENERLIEVLKEVLDSKEEYDG